MNHFLTLGFILEISNFQDLLNKRFGFLHKNKNALEFFATASIAEIKVPKQKTVAKGKNTANSMCKEEPKNLGEKASSSGQVSVSSKSSGKGNIP